MMGYKGWIFPLILAASGKLLAEDKLCDLPNIENGRIALYYYSFKNHYFPMKKGGKLPYSCLAGYTTESGSHDAKLNCTMRGWAPAPKCYKKCPKPTVDNGVFLNTKLSYKIWESLKYSCDSSYWTPGGSREETIQCLPDGWSSLPRCMEANGTTTETCLAPDLPHGHYHTAQRVFSFNEKLKYECDDGYQTTGGNTTEEVLCQPHGWSLIPKCSELGCSALSRIEHGGFHPRKGSYEEGIVVQFFCLEGYSLKGPELIQCYYFGWYPEPPVCEERRNKCPRPPQPPNAKLLMDGRTYRHGDVVHLECEKPFQIRGAEEIRCENGQWTLPPQCIHQSPFKDVGRLASTDGHFSQDDDDENCSSPPIVKNGIFSLSLTSYKTGSAVKYRCLPFYLIHGLDTIHCVHGNWTEPPICLEPCLFDEENASRYNIEMKWRLEGEPYFLHGDIIEFVCQAGYVLPLSVRESQLLVQCNNGELKYPMCVSKDPSGNCGSPPSVANGVIMGDGPGLDYAHGSSILYRCCEHHFLQGSRTVSCSRGEWTTPPVCIEPCILSEEEMVKNNLALKWNFDNRSFVHGEFVEFRCKAYPFRTTSGSSSDLRVQCQNGQLLYPECI
ncbi:coagulation factor XIII B chain-like isoform X2 [Hemicordylus capensis]|uniref:coagulation factor XIII B chain-like isoform X2 n=1 Tax=Hemicordylus capensis TaxID=884348 RepID=UPI002303FFF0|nr:coagulation factor XIII B chain-like isoform X2 [Hemicordylus capensis]